MNARNELEGKVGELDVVQLEKRLTELATRAETYATEKDISDLKTLIENKTSSLQRWAIGVLITACITTTIALIRLFSIPSN